MLALEDQVRRIVDQLGSQSSEIIIRRLAEDELINLGPSIIPILIPILASGNLWTTSSIIEVIGRIGSIDNAVSIRPFLKTKDLMILRKTVYALARIGDPDAVDTILEILQHPSWHVKYACADALSVYFIHIHLHEHLYFRFLTAFFQSNNREDIVLAKFSEMGWETEILLQNPAKYLKFLLQKCITIPLSPGELALLKHFAQLSLTLIEDLILTSKSEFELSALSNLQYEINEFCSLSLNESYKLLL